MAVTDPLVVGIAITLLAGAMSWAAWMSKTILDIVRVVAGLKQEQEQHAERLEHHETWMQVRPAAWGLRKDNGT